MPRSEPEVGLISVWPAAIGSQVGSHSRWTAAGVCGHRWKGSLLLRHVWTLVDTLGHRLEIYGIRRLAFNWLPRTLNSRNRGRVQRGTGSIYSILSVWSDPGPWGDAHPRSSMPAGGRFRGDQSWGSVLSLAPAGVPSSLACAMMVPHWRSMSTV